HDKNVKYLKIKMLQRIITSYYPYFYKFKINKNLFVINPNTSLKMRKKIKDLLTKKN
ncbi:unnamed protein product, partial [Diamesa serratosioi]